MATTVFLPNVRLRYCNANGQPLMVGSRALVFDSASTFAQLYKRMFAGVDSQHNIAPGEFEPGSNEDEVRAIFGIEDQVTSKVLGSWAELRGGGYYHETWKLKDGQWYIQELELRRTYQNATLLVQVLLALMALLGIAP
ncbi:hypothetical protein CC79DRAFT_1369561 [Sarocladium strictum]